MELKQLANQIEAGHKMLALLTKNPMWVISADESVRLANAIKSVLVFHNMSINPKMAAYGELAIALVMIYGSRLGMMAMQKQAEKKKQAAQFTPQNQTAQATSNFAAPVSTGKMQFN